MQMPMGLVAWVAEVAEKIWNYLFWEGFSTGSIHTLAESASSGSIHTLTEI
jgi:hypothetical protein